MVIARSGMILVCNIRLSRYNEGGDAISPIRTIDVWMCIGFHSECAGLCGDTGNRIYSWTKQGMGIKRHNQDALPVSLKLWNDIGLHTPCYNMTASHYVPWTCAGMRQRKCRVHSIGLHLASLLGRWNSGYASLPTSIIDNIIGFGVGIYVPAHFARTGTVT